jgi:hypothetical protein
VAVQLRSFIAREVKRDWYVVAIAAVVLAVWLVAELRWGPTIASFKLANDSRAVRRVTECSTSRCNDVFDRGARVKARSFVTVDVLVGHHNTNWYAVFDDAGNRLGCVTLAAPSKQRLQTIPLSSATPCAATASLACTVRLAPGKSRAASCTT